MDKLSINKKKKISKFIILGLGSRPPGGMSNGNTGFQPPNPPPPPVPPWRRPCTNQMTVKMIDRLIDSFMQISSPKKQAINNHSERS